MTHSRKHETMKASYLLLGCIFFAVSPSLPAQAPTTEQPQAPEQAFETSGLVDAKLFVPEKMMTGSLHSVDEHAYNDGLQNIYQLTSEGRTLEITTTPLLIQRINEIYALDYLRGLSKTEEFGKALANSAKAKGRSIVGIVKDPVGTVKNLPKGASRFFGGIGEAMKGGKSETEGGTLDSLSGTNKAKAALALKLGVSPYTDNQALQEELTNTARAMAGGGLVLGAATMAVTGGAGVALTVVGVNQTLQETLVNSTPEELRIINRKKLFALGLNREQADAFLMHPQYSPWHKTIITDALARIGVSPKAFLKEACKASNQEDAFYFQRLAQLLLQYHETTAPIRSVRIENGIACGLDRNRTLLVPVSLDYAIWNERVAGRANEFATLVSDGREIKTLALWTDGELSPRLGRELTTRGISWKVHALDATN
jgi:hypothetical protein